MSKARFAVGLLLAMSATPAQEYRLGPDSERQAGVPRGTLTRRSWTSAIYPGTTRDYWVYVPAQYTPARPAALVVVQDGKSFSDENGYWRTPAVLDNLIHRGEMPVTVGVFIDPGVLPAARAGESAQPDRSVEYDAVTDRYARFLLEELLPDALRDLNVSSDPDLRAILGSSSGGICAFVAAWHRPDSFHRVATFIGSYANLRGGDTLASLIRKTEPKPLRVFLQDGSGDLNQFAGNWFLANQEMASALEYAGYDATHVWGTDGHSSRHGGSILPEALRWLWRGFPALIEKPKGGGGDRQYSVLLPAPGKDWELVSQGHKLTEGPAVDRHGNVFFTDIRDSKIWRAGTDGKVSVFVEDSGGSNGAMFGPDGRLYACQNGRKRIVAYSPDGKESVIAEDVASNDLAVTAGGAVYFTDPRGHRVWHVDPAGQKRVVHEGIAFPNGVRLSPGQQFLVVADYAGRSVWRFAVQQDGSLAGGDAAFRLEAPDDTGVALADGMAFDTEGWLYVATATGIQVIDPPGRVVAILNKPQPGVLTNLVFGGPDRDILYATAGDKVFRRPMRRKGVVSWEPAAAKTP